MVSILAHDGKEGQAERRYQTVRRRCEFEGILPGHAARAKSGLKCLLSPLAWLSKFQPEQPKSAQMSLRSLPS